ncbi:conserved hypothetical protein (plasmid) [Paraburkholderia phymatum STM815]|uniref:Invasion gene expression up-regulator SirB n=2 Tax=Paraburkholderia phymatum TaxID=148447 RepID=B2JWA9_PARP8|nr:conserved hypothetical protein [Paraburkholderia phymatum STM815]
MLKFAHVTLVTASGMLFAARSIASLNDYAWPMRDAWRRLSYVIDTLLLAAGASLWLLLRLNPIRDAWLGTKLLLVVAYVIAGTLAMKRGRPWGTRVASLGCALLLFALIASVAATHNPSGWFGVRQ